MCPAPSFIEASSDTSVLQVSTKSAHSLSLWGVFVFYFVDTRPAQVVVVCYIRNLFSVLNLAKDFIIP